MFRIVAAYIPHCGYSDAKLEEHYKHIESVIAEARKQKKMVVVGADCNAEVGGTRRFGKTYGGFGNLTSTARGEWLKACASKFGMTLVNTFFMKQWSSVWAHAVGTAKQQRKIYYIWLDQNQIHNVTNAEATDEICAGSDHRAVKMLLDIKGAKRNRWKEIPTQGIVQ